MQYMYIRVRLVGEDVLVVREPAIPFSILFEYCQGSATSVACSILPCVSGRCQKMVSSLNKLHVDMGLGKLTPKSIVLKEEYLF